MEVLGIECSLFNNTAKYNFLADLIQRYATHQPLPDQGPVLSEQVLTKGLVPVFYRVVPVITFLIKQASLMVGNPGLQSMMVLHFRIAEGFHTTAVVRGQCCCCLGSLFLLLPL